MDLESVVRLSSILLQVVTWGSVAVHFLAANPLSIRSSGAWVIACVVSLGSVNLVAAALQIFCAVTGGLTCGLAVVLVLRKSRLTMAADDVWGWTTQEILNT